VPVTVSNGTYSKNGGAYQATSTTAQNGDTFGPGHVASSSNSTATTTTLTIGGVSGTATSTTLAAAQVLPSVSISGPASVAEGNSGATVVTYTLTRTGDLSGTSSVVATASGFGTNQITAADLVGGVWPSSTINWVAGESSKTFAVNVAGDTTVEPDEGMVVTLSNAVGCQIGTGTVSTTVTNDDVATSPTPAPYTVMFIGSSTPDRYFTDATGPANSGVTKSTDGVNWTPVGTTGAGASVFGDELQKALNRPIRLIDRGESGTRVLEWESNLNNMRTNAIAAANAAGGVDLVISIVGFNDANHGVMVSRADHEAKLRSLFAALRTGIRSTLPIMMGFSQKFGGASDATKDAKFNDLNAAEIAVTADANNLFGAHSYDLPQLSDGIHQQDASYPIHARRLAANVIRHVNGQSMARGPSVTSIDTVSQTETRVMLAHSTGTDFTPTTGITGFEVSTDGFTSNVSISAVARVSASVIAITHAAAAAGSTLGLRLLANANPARSAPVKDNSTLALPVSPTSGALTDSVPGTGTGAAHNGIVQINFTSDGLGASGPAAAAPPGWQNFALPENASGVSPLLQNGKSIQLKDTNGVDTGWTATIISAPNGGHPSNGTSTGNNSGIFPDDVLKSYWFNGDSTVGTARTPSTTIRFRGPNANEKLQIAALSSRSTGTRSTTFSAGGISETQNSSANTSVVTTTLVELAPDANGNIDFTFTPAGSGQYGYLNGSKLLIGGAAATTPTPAPTFTPTSLFSTTSREAGVWYDPSDLSSMWQDSAGTVAAAVDQPVGRINDKSGNGFHATQDTAASRPMLRLDSGGRYYLEGDGVDDWLRATFTIPQPFVRISAVRQIAWAQPKRLFGGGNAAGGIIRGLTSSPTLGMFAGSNGPSTSGLAIGVNTVLTERFSGSTSRVATNNGAYATGDAGSTLPGGLTLFANFDGTNPGNMRCYGLLMIGRDLTDTEVTDTRAFMAAKAGVTL